ncbi:MAG: ABC transporter substrate-binding protein [Alphaproteobacteria bacterium]|nr:ABC transporter substrate-binding protein [Alphaproteobacteria bacterium]
MFAKRVSFLRGAVGALILMSGTALAADYQQAPSLDGMAGLPAVAERLPDEPMVVTPLQSVGKYGGDFRTGLIGSGGSAQMIRFHAYEPMVRFSADWSTTVPNVAEAVDVNDAATEFTFHLRKGMKWSDGVSFTADDVMFWYNDIFNDPEINMDPQRYLVVGGEKAVFEKIDDYTYKVSFATANGLFLQQIAWGNNDQTTRFPKHYFEQFHGKYNSDANKLADEAGFAGWPQLFEEKGGIQLIDNYFRNDDVPVLTAWKMDVPMGESTSQVVTERNAYYWKVDTGGNQLPYFNRVLYDLVTDEQVLLLKVMQGEIDMIDQYVATPNNKSVLFDNQEAGGYKFYDLLPTQPNELVIQLNFTHPDMTKRALFQNKDFRIGMSQAIDRQALIDAVFVGQGSPAQPSILEGDSLYNERLARQYTEYDVDAANAALDKVIPNKNADGMRLDAEGRLVTIVFEIDQARQKFLDMFQLALPMWQAVGLDTQIRTMDRSLWEVRVRRGFEFDATAHRFGGGAGQAAMIDARYFAPDSTNTMYARGWQAWFVDPTNENAVEPPANAKKIVALYQQVKSTADGAMQTKLFKEILELNADEFYLIGITHPAVTYGIVRTDLGNVPDVMPNSYGYPNPAPANPETFFRK